MLRRWQWLHKQRDHVPRSSTQQGQQCHRYTQPKCQLLIKLIISGSSLDNLRTTTPTAHLIVAAPYRNESLDESQRHALPIDRVPQ